MSLPHNKVRQHLGIDSIHTYWDRDLPPKLTIEPGETVSFDIREPSQGKVAREFVARGREDISVDVFALIERDAELPAATGPGTEQGGHALTGPVAIAGAEPGDTLVVEVLSVETSDWGWTSCGPVGSGCFIASDLQTRYAHVWDLRSRTHAVFAPGIRVPISPFCGVMGVALAEPGRRRTSPPTRAAGNIDVRQLVAGSTLFIPVQVPGGLFSTGDAHAAQGDGEVASTAIETDARAVLRFGLRKAEHLTGPRLITPSLAQAPGPWFAAMGSQPKLVDAAREALRGVINYLEKEKGLTRPQAIVLASACVDLRISQAVNAEIYTVSAFLPLSIFESG